MSDKLQEIEKENFIIFIYFILLFIYLYANNVELEYLKYNNVEYKEKYQLLLYLVFGSSLIISLYFTLQSIKDLNNYTSSEIYKLKRLSTLANILIVISTIIYIYIIYKDKDINLEVSP